jgi:hypothetical protein
MSGGVKTTTQPSAASQAGEPNSAVSYLATPLTGLRRDFRVIPGRWQRGEKVFPLRVK